MRDLSEIETATFWKDAPEVTSGEVRPEDIQTEVFLMPAASHVEKEGTFTNTQRLVQYRDKALEPPGDARSELWFVHHLRKRVKAHYADSDRPQDWPIRNLHWDYEEHGETREPDVEAVGQGDQRLRRRDGRPLNGFTELRSRRLDRLGLLDLLRHLRTASTRPAGATRRPQRPGGLRSPEWAWAWPANRRILYNRASADPEGKPWSERKKLRLVGRAGGEVDGVRRPRLPAGQAPGLPPVRRRPRHGRDRRRRPVHDDGRRPRLAVLAERPARRPDADALRAARVARRQPPLPEPQRNPAAIRWERDDNPYNPTADPDYPIVATTFRLTEHHTAGGMSRPLPWLSELQPEMFAEISPMLARERGIADGDWMTIATTRARSRRAPR